MQSVLAELLHCSMSGQELAHDFAAVIDSLCPRLKVPQHLTPCQISIPLHDRMRVAPLERFFWNTSSQSYRTGSVFRAARHSQRILPWRVEILNLLRTQRLRRAELMGSERHLCKVLESFHLLKSVKQATAVAHSPVIGHKYGIVARNVGR